MLTISRITKDDQGRLTFQVTNQDGEGTYRTDQQGRGLWGLKTVHGLHGTGEYTEWNQILGTDQLDLTAGNARAKIAHFFLDGDPDYENFLLKEGMKDSLTAVTKYLKAQK